MPVSAPLPQPSSYRWPATLRAVLRNGRLAWRAVRDGDQSILINTLLDLARAAEHPDAYVLDTRPVGPALLVVYSAEGLRALGSCAAIDKRPTGGIAIAVSGQRDAYEGIMGMATDGPYAAQIELVDAVIKRVQRGLKRAVQRRVAEHLAPPCEFTTRQVQYLTASVILDQFFPAHAWTRAAITETIDALEHNSEVIGPLMQTIAMRGLDPTTVLAHRDHPGVVARYEGLLGPLAEEERAAVSRGDGERDVGLITQLEREGTAWPDIKALVTTFVAASYETVSSTLTEWVYQVSASPSTWRALQDAEGNERRRRIQASIYEAVRIATPLPILLRQAERACELDVEASPEHGGRRSLAIERGQLILGLNLAPLLDPAVFPDPLRMRLELDPTQRDRIRLAWGLEARERSGAPNRFCQGFHYSIALMTATIERLLDDYAAPKLVQDSPIVMLGTRARRRFVAQLRPRAS